MLRFFSVALFGLLTACAPPRSSWTIPPRPKLPGDLFDNVVAALRRTYYDTAFVRTQLGTLSEEFRPATAAAANAIEEREVIWRFLSRIPASHLGLLSRSAYDALMDDIVGNSRVMPGMQLVGRDGRYFASMVLTGGPADHAGIAEWDEIVSIDSEPPAHSHRVGWRSDDAFLPDEGDPPVYGLQVSLGDTLQLRVVRVPGETLSVRVVSRMYSMLRAAGASARLVNHNGVRVGYMHWWFMHARGLSQTFAAALRDPLKTSEVLLLDLRGRGGVESAIKDVLRMLAQGPKQRFAGPVVALIDRQTRSAKERLAYELRARGLGRLVGEPTAGAFLGAGFELVSDDMILMLPSMAMPTYTALIERHPVEPDVLAPVPGPYAAGHDPLFVAGLAEAARLVRERGPGRTTRGR